MWKTEMELSIWRVTNSSCGHKGPVRSFFRGCLPLPFLQRGMQNADDLLRHNEVKACEREAALTIYQTESTEEAARDD